MTKSKEEERWHWPQPVFVGGCTPKRLPLKLAKGWRFAQDGAPSPEFHIVRVCAFRTLPDGDYIRLYKWALKPALHAKERERIERLRLTLLREDNEAIQLADRRLLAAKNRRNGVRAPRCTTRRKKAARR